MKKLVEESLNEFKRGQDPAKALGIGYGNKPKTKAWKVLDFIGSKGEKGAGITEIQHFVWTVLHGRPEESFWKKGLAYAWLKGHDEKIYLRNSRGYWSTNLYGSHSTEGLLRKYCTKNAEGRWVLVRMPGPGENIF